MPNTIDEPWIGAFAAGLARDQAEYGLHLIGGDTSSTTGPITIAITALGEAPIGRIIRRGGAQAGDTVFVTGTLGDAALGLAALRATPPSLDALRDLLGAEVPVSLGEADARIHAGEAPKTRGSWPAVATRPDRGATVKALQPCIRLIIARLLTNFDATLLLQSHSSGRPNVV